MKVNDDQTVEDAQHITLNPIPTVIPTNERRDYKVTSEVPLFKEGKLYEQGDTVNLNVHEANLHIDLGDVEELSND